MCRRFLCGFGNSRQPHQFPSQFVERIPIFPVNQVKMCGTYVKKGARLGYSQP